MFGGPERQAWGLPFFWNLWEVGFEPTRKTNPRSPMQVINWESVCFLALLNGLPDAAAVARRHPETA